MTELLNRYEQTFAAKSAWEYDEESEHGDELLLKNAYDLEFADKYPTGSGFTEAERPCYCNFLSKPPKGYAKFGIAHPRGLCEGTLDWKLPDGPEFGEKAAQRQIAMLRRAGNRPTSGSVSHPDAFDDERKAVTEGIWTRLSGGPDGNPKYQLTAEWRAPAACVGTVTEADDTSDANKWRGRSVSSVPTA